MQTRVSVNTERILEARPHRQTAVAAQHLLHQVIRMSADDDSDLDACAESRSDGLAAFEEDEEGSIGIGSNQESSDIKVIGANITVTPGGERTLVAPYNRPPPPQRQASPMNPKTKPRWR